MVEEFRKLGLSEPFVKIIERAKFVKPSEIQEKTIPLAMKRMDVIGGSATGTGKTLAFAASIIEHSQRGEGIQAIILTPTRELAEQVGKVFKHFSVFKSLSTSIIYGGVGMSPQVDALKSADIVVGTPGRILDHLEHNTLKLSKIKTLVLDEADRMLDMGFIEDVQRIISACPKERQTMLFSATITPDITYLSKEYMKNPVDISVESYVDASKLKQAYYDVPKNVKFALLVHLLKQEKAGLVMVFCNTRNNTDFVEHNLEINGIRAMAIHGGLSQQRRNKIMENFHSKSVYVLVCTDVAARGLDIKGVSHVYNYDTPPSSKEYVHRIGRTARAGDDGIAISLVSERDYENFRNVLEDASLKIESIEVPQDLPRVKIHIDRSQRSPRGYERERRDFSPRRSIGRGRRRF
jgi:ATP-dependent RNA helicase DeaD